jgi:Secretion system C-terminal sorting domain
LKTVILLLLLCSAISVEAQPSIEFANGSGPSTSGSSIAPQVITFQSNLNNPSGNTFTTYVPTTTATFSISNQQYTLPTSQNSNGADVSFGATSNSTGPSIGSFAQFTDMGAVSMPLSSIFTSTNTAGTIGTGISTTSNYATEVFTSTMGLYNAGAPTNGTYLMADLTITFSSPVTDPVLQLVGVGGTYGSGHSTLGFTTEFTLLTSGVTMSELSGSTELSVTSTQILNTATTPTATTGAGAASGSILVTGVGITQLTFAIYMRGDGDNSAWSNGAEHTGDAWLIGVSALNTDIVLPLTIAGFTAQPQGNAAQLDWSTASEENTDHFGILYSTDGNSWQNIGEVKAAGNSATPSNYQFVQPNPASGNNFYRIMEVALDGSVSYSDTKELQFIATASGLSFYPNPTKDRVTIINNAVPLSAVSVLTIDGRTLQQNPAFTSGQSMDLSRYPAGIYFLSIRRTDGTREVVKIEKN